MYKRKRKTTTRKPTARKSTTRKPNTSPLERDEQELLFEWIEYATCKHPEVALCFHIPNGGHRNAREAHNLRLQGVRAGVPDICLPVPRGGYGALYVELKRKRGGRVSEQQRVWIDALNRAGNKAVVCYGFDEAKKAIEDYLNS